ncbi:hypothetical protein Tsubulata_042960, partial [Turnera subulata]
MHLAQVLPLKQAQYITGYTPLTSKPEGLIGITSPATDSSRFTAATMATVPGSESVVESSAASPATIDRDAVGMD